MVSKFKLTYHVWWFMAEINFHTRQSKAALRVVSSMSVIGQRSIIIHFISHIYTIDRDLFLCYT